MLIPVRTCDTHDGTWMEVLATPGGQTAMADWLISNGVDPNITFRWELYVMDTPFLKVFTYVKGEGGGVLIDRETETLVTREFTTPVSSLPPNTEVATPQEGGPFR